MILFASRYSLPLSRINLPLLAQHAMY